MKPSVSVIIPCYNAEEWIERQIDAVQAQLEARDELVLVDNRSTDGTRLLLERAATADPRIRVVSAPDRPGGNHARNRGLNAATGDLLVFCDADDLVRPGWLAALRGGLDCCSLVGGLAIPVDTRGHRVAEDIALPAIFGGPAYPLAGNLGMRREVYETIGGFDESFVGGHDEADFGWRAAKAGFPACLVEEAKIEYVQRPTLKGTVQQRRHYGRTSVLLWTRHQDLADPHGVSLKGAVRAVIRELRLWRGVGSGTATQDEAASLGWSLGVLEGHLRYRVLRRVPPTAIPE